MALAGSAYNLSFTAFLSFKTKYCHLELCPSCMKKYCEPMAAFIARDREINTTSPGKNRACWQVLDFTLDLPSFTIQNYRSPYKRDNIGLENSLTWCKHNSDEGIYVCNW